MQRPLGVQMQKAASLAKDVGRLRMVRVVRTGAPAHHVCLCARVCVRVCPRVMCR